MILPGERIDKIGFGNLRLIQKPEDFCYGVDAVILADFASQKKANHIVDLGTGTGIVPHILSHKTDAKKIYGVEVQEDTYLRAKRNQEINGLKDRISFVLANVKDSLPIEDGWADVVTTNPPYMINQGGITNKTQAKTIARHEALATLEDFVACGTRLLKTGGHFYLVHRPSRLVDIFTTCRKHRLEPKEIRFVSSKLGETPNIVLVHCVKNGGKELKFLPTLYVYKENGEYTEEINVIYERY
ncbi:MAG: tRNA1(Val) (adenine(37)-N6)-methyltransferase [Anaerovoracaceae bacterium]